MWTETDKQLPPLGQVIEGINPPDWLYSNLGRDYFALVKIQRKLIWITPSLCDMNYEELRITHWRTLQQDPSGKMPFVKVIKNDFSWKPKVIFKKIK
jgi:hypothetical protein